MPAGWRSAAEALRPLLAHEAAAQLIRFAVAGAGVTALAAAAYLAAATRIPPLAANAVATALGVVVGYLVHSRWTFRAEPGDETATAVRFLVAAGFAFALNSGWVWLAVDWARLPAWTPVGGMMFATPLASFAVNRWWVFAA